jgi:hypothetical protein
MLRVAVPARDDRPYVAIHSPAELADTFSAARELATTERKDLKEDFLRIRR